VSAANAVGTGPFAVATQPVAAPYFPYAVPSVPAGAVLTSGIAASTSALQIDWQTPDQVLPLGVNGSPVSSYQVDYGTRRLEVQTITIATTTALVTGASSPQYTITLPISGSAATAGDSTPCLSWDADATTVASALNLLPAIDGVSVSRSVALLGFVYSVTFTGPYAVNGNVAPLTTSTSACSGRVFPGYATAGVATATEGAPGPVPEVLLLSTDAASAISGSMTLSYNYVGTVFTAVTCASCTAAYGSATVTTTADMRPHFARGDRVSINGFLFRVHATATFDCTRLPLSEAYPAPSGPAAIGFENSRIGFASVAGNSGTMQRSPAIAEAPTFGTVRNGDKIRMAGGVYTLTAYVFQVSRCTPVRRPFCSCFLCRLPVMAVCSPCVLLPFLPRPCVCVCPARQD
jgi:hypothetical protein